MVSAGKREPVPPLGEPSSAEVDDSARRRAAGASHIDAHFDEAVDHPQDGLHAGIISQI
jgi:hypothetical protein